MNAHHPPKVKWLPTEEDKKDCHHCRNGWVLVKTGLGYRAHWNGPDTTVTCYATGPLVLAPPPSKRSRAEWKALMLKKTGYFLVGDVAIAAVVAIVWVIYQGVYFVLDRLPGGMNQALHLAKVGVLDLILGIAMIYGLTVAGEFLWNTLKKTTKATEPTT